MFSIKSLLVAALAVSAAAALDATAVEFTVGDTSNLACLGSSVPASRQSNVQGALAAGTYVVVPDLPLANCGSSVFYLNLEGDPSVSFDAIAIGASADATLGLGPTAWSQSSSGAASFDASYTVSPANGRRVVL